MERMKTFLTIVPFCEKCGYSTVETRGKVCARCGAELPTYEAVVYPPQFVDEPQPERRDP